MKTGVVSVAKNLLLLVMMIGSSAAATRELQDDKCSCDDNDALFRSCGAPASSSKVADSKSSGYGGKRGRTLEHQKSRPRGATTTTAAQEGQRHLMVVRNKQKKKKTWDKDEVNECKQPPPIPEGTNIEIGDLTVRTGVVDNLDVLSDCDCRMDVETMLLKYLKIKYDSTPDFEFLCLAILGAGDGRLTTTVTFQVNNVVEATYEAESTCSIENHVLCQVAQASSSTEFQVVAGTDCSDCGPDLAFGGGGDTSSCDSDISSLDAFLSCSITKCATTGN